MLRKWIYALIGGVLLVLPGAAVGLFIGAIIGGNFMTGFQFGGVQGYEATGVIGAYIGIAVGGLIGCLAGLAFYRRRENKRK